jgi:outer membrane protein assembly factor BamB
VKSTRIAVVLACSCLLPVAWCQQPTDWAQFHRLNMRRYNPYEKVIGVDNVGSLKLKWSFTLDGPSDSTPVLAGGVVYTSSYNGVFYALNASTGTLSGTYRTASGGQNNATPAVANGVVYFGYGVIKPVPKSTPRPQ